MKLFWKLFIALGVAITVAMVAAVSMGWQIGQLTGDQAWGFGFDYENRERVLEDAQRELNSGGRDALAGWLRQNQSPDLGWMLLILDERGNELLNREFPAWARGAVIRELWQRRRSNDGRDAPFASNRNRSRFQFETLYAPNGDAFTPLFFPTNLTVLNILALPTTQVALVTAAIIMAAVTALLLAKYFSSPIVRLQRATRALAAGSLEARVGEPFDRRNDEIGTLAKDFDGMAEKVQALITDKEVLLRDVSHELRSPLARIRVALALAQRKTGGSADQDLERIEQETERLDHLVGQILTLARLRTATADRHDDVELAELLSDVVEDARFEHAEVEITFEAQPVPPVVGNAGELASAFENILRNALVYSGDASEVKIGLARAGSWIVVTIADSGPGVPESDLKRLFEPFYRVDPSRDHGRGGYGLGLAIAAGIIEKHGGTIEARNRPAGGLAVSFKLPAGH